MKPRKIDEVWKNKDPFERLSISQVNPFCYKSYPVYAKSWVLKAHIYQRLYVKQNQLIILSKNL